ncbi:MAG: ATP-dependent zinc metalloprotease FtsH, partial [Planctomycetota bacterium]
MQNKQEPEEKPSKDGFDPRQYRTLLIWFALAGLILLAVSLSEQKRSGKVQPLQYSELKDEIRQNKIKKLEINRKTYHITGEKVSHGQDASEAIHFSAQGVERDIDNLVDLCDQQVPRVNHKFVQPSGLEELMNGLISFFPYMLLFGIIYFILIRQMRSMGGGGMLSFGKSRATRITRDKIKKTFADVAGIDEAKEEVLEIIEFLRSPEKFRKLGGRMPHGCLLIGPPGTGKTLLAKAIAGEADVPFFSISGSDFVEMFVGVGASRVRDLFEQAKRSSPCIIFLDEIDAVGRKRGTGVSGGHDEREQTLNAILVEMDGFDTEENVIVMAATNRADVLDQALLRPGRFDRRVYVDLPDLKGREAILEVHGRDVVMGKEVDLKRIARGTPGFAGADLENLINEGAILAAMRDANEVAIKDLEDARDKVLWGKEKRSRVMTESAKRETAYHEAGHALLNHLLEDVSPLHKVTIIPRGRMLGATMQLPDKDEYGTTRKKIYGEIKLMLAGRVAEELFCDDISSGASNDLERATQLVRSMICDWGMTEALGLVHYGMRKTSIQFQEVPVENGFSEKTAQRIDT